MSILVNKNDTFSIPVIVGVTDAKPPVYYCCLASNEEKATKDWPANARKEAASFTFCPVNFKINSEVIDRSVEITNQGMRINSACLRYNRILATLVGWSLVD